MVLHVSVLMFSFLLILHETESVSDGRFLATSVSSASVQSASPFVVRKNRNPVSRSPPPNASPIVPMRKKNSPSTERKTHPPRSRQTNHNKNSDWKVQTAVSHAPPLTDACEEKLPRNENNARSKFEARRLLFENKSEDKAAKPGGGLKSASRVVPFEGSGGSEVITAEGNTNDEPHGDHKDADLSLIRRQLLQIETKQSSLLDLLQVSLH